jgi:hypothetical protein
MQGSLDSPPIIVRSSKWTALWMLVVSILFVGIFVLMLRDPNTTKQSQLLIAYTGTGFFGLGILVFLTRLLRPDTLEIAPHGLILCSLVRSMSFRWEDVRDFRSYRPTARVRSPHVGFDFADNYKPGKRASRLALRQFAGVEGSLGGGWELDATELAHLLNSARARWTSDH